MQDDDPAAVFIHRQDTVLWANGAAAELLGYPAASELLGQPVSALIEEPSRSLWCEHLEHVAARASARDPEAQIVTRQGTTLQTELHSIAISFEGQPAVQTTLLEPLAVRELEAAVKNYQCASPRAFDERSVGVLLADPFGAIRESNLTALELLGYSAFVLRSLDLATLCPDADGVQLRALRDALKLAARGAHVPSLELTLRHRSGRPRRVMLEIEPSHRSGRALVLLRPCVAPPSFVEASPLSSS